MPKRARQAQEAEYSRLRTFVQVVLEESLSGVEGLPKDAYPSVVADRLWASSPALALKGLRMAASDMVEATQDLNGASLEALEARLLAAGAPSLASFRSQRVGQIFEILGRGKLETDDEARLLQAVLSDTAERILDAGSQQLASELLDGYERRRRLTEQ